MPSGPIRDLGSRGLSTIQRSVANATRPLEPHGRQVVKRDAEMGHDILVPAEHVREVAEAVHPQDERFAAAYPWRTAG